MKLLVLVEQHLVQLANGEIWTNDMVNALFWERYLNVFEDIIVCGRIMKRNDNDSSGLAKSSREHVRFIPLPDFRGIGGILKNIFKIRSILKVAISQSDCIIYRAPSPISLVAYPLIRDSNKPFACPGLPDGESPVPSRHEEAPVCPRPWKVPPAVRQAPCRFLRGQGL